MKSTFDWIIKNAWNLFGAIGVAGTFYFSLVHVPDYVKEINTSKVSVIHESLLDNLQEFLFHDQTINIEDVRSFIEGKELKYGVDYPYNPDEVLIQIQERFMGNKFIPLAKRETLLENIKSVRATYSEPAIEQSNSLDKLNYLAWFLSMLGVFTAIVGAASLWRKIKYDRETEADIDIVEVESREHRGTVTSGIYEFEKMVGDVLSELGVLQSPSNSSHDFGYDFIANGVNGAFIVEVKRYKRMLGVGTARGFMHAVSESKKGGILIVSSGVTQRTKKLVNEHNKISESNKVFIVVGDSKDIIKEQLTELLVAKSDNKNNV